MNWNSQLLKTPCFFTVIKLWNLKVSQLSQSSGSMNASSFGTEHETLPHIPVFRNTRSSSQRQILLNLLISFIKWQKLFYCPWCCLKYTSSLKITLCTHMLVEMVVVVFANYWGLIPPWFQFSTWGYISWYKAPLLYPGGFPQVFKESSINPSVKKNQNPEPMDKNFAWMSWLELQ